MLGLPLRSSNPDLADKKYIAAMFGSGEQGAWYDPSDLSTLYQDAAGTIPVTGMEQPVGRILDKSGRGNHATQTTTASRPTLSARYNLFLDTGFIGTSLFSWLRKGRLNWTLNTLETTDPNGGNTALKIEILSGSNLGYFGTTLSVIPNTTYRYRFYAKRGTMENPRFLVMNNNSYTIINSAYYTSQLSSGDWALIDVTFTTPASTTSIIIDIVWDCGPGSIYLWNPDLRVANESASLPAYQRVNTGTDYDTAGFPYYLLFDGIDDSLMTGNINFTATDKMTVLTADHSAWDDVTRVITGLSSSAFWFDGTFWLTSYDGAYSAKSVAYLRGNLRGAAFYGPDQRTLGVRRLVRSFRFDISKDVLANETLIRLNGVPTPLTGTPFDPSAGSGNFGNWPLYIGMVGNQYQFSGRLYGLIVRGAATDDNHLTHAEKYLAYKSGVSL